MRIIEATARSHVWRDRVLLALGFAEDVARRCSAVRTWSTCCRVGTDTDTERLRIQDAYLADKYRLAVLRADASGLAFRVAREGIGSVGAELVLALKECLQACEAVVGDLIAARPRLRAGWDDFGSRREHASWLRSVRTAALEKAADAHREAEIARNAHNTRAAGRLFAIKNRFEWIAAALEELAAHSDGREE